jgi:hypothetical protein
MVFWLCPCEERICGALVIKSCKPDLIPLRSELQARNFQEKALSLEFRLEHCGEQ